MKNQYQSHKMVRAKRIAPFIIQNLDHIQEFFKDVKITLLVRSETDPRAHYLVTQDDFDTIVKALREVEENGNDFGEMTAKDRV